MKTLFGTARTPGQSVLILVASLVLALPAFLQPAQALEDDARALQARLAAAVGAAGTDPAAERLVAIRDFYSARDFSSLWAAKGKPNDKAQAARDVLHGADRDGLIPDDYLAGVTPLPEKFSDAGEVAQFEISMSDAILHFLGDLRTGRVAPSRLDPDLFVANAVIDRRAALEAIAAAPDLRGVVVAYTPANPVYRNLRDSLAAYRRLAAMGNWPTVPDGPKLTLGDSGPRVKTLRARLAATIDLLDPDIESETFDDALKQATIVFQKRHGLDPDGVVGRATRAALNVSVESRIAQIMLNMERWRWMPDDLGERHVLVNIPAFSLQGIENGRIRTEMRVVVGKEYRRTPVFSDRISYLELNPFWHVPPKIAANDVLPKILADPTYVTSAGFSVLDGWGANARTLDPAAIEWSALGPGKFPYKLRQNPGPQNALGRVKFMFPNKHDVYLHDSPARELFGRTLRTFSSGCIRVERPLDLAAFVLDDQAGWRRADIEQAIAGKDTRIVRLDTPVPVHLTYFTAWSSEDGTVNFRQDIYGRDSALAKALPARQT